MSPRVVRRIAAQHGCVVKAGGKHFRVETKDGRLVALAPMGITRDRAALSPEKFLAREIKRGLSKFKTTNH